MLTRWIVPIFAVLFVGILWMATDMKNSYKLLPIKTNSQLEVPPFADWREFVPKSEKFKVTFPAPPQYAKEAIEIPGTNLLRRYEMYVSEKLDGDVFMISLISYPEGYDISNSKQLLRELIEEMKISKPGNQIKKLNEKTFQKQEALEFNIANPKFGVEGVAFLLDRTVYLLTYVADTADFSMNEYEHFIHSFQLMGVPVSK